MRAPMELHTCQQTARPAHRLRLCSHTCTSRVPAGQAYTPSQINRHGAGLQGPDLAAKSANRFVAHSFLPILSLVAAEQAARAGVAWAGLALLPGWAACEPFFNCARLEDLADDAL